MTHRIWWTDMVHGTPPRLYVVKYGGRGMFVNFTQRLIPKPVNMLLIHYSSFLLDEYIFLYLTKTEECTKDPIYKNIVIQLN